MSVGRVFSLWSANYIVIIFLTSVGVSQPSQGIRGPASDFSKYTVVQPSLRHGRTKREISSTEHSSGVHEPEVTLALEMGGKQHELELQLNTDLIPDRHVLSYQQGGRTRVHTSTREEVELCQYGGRVRGRPGSWAAVSTCRGVRGVIYDGHHMRYIEPAHGDAIQSPHYLYAHVDLNTRHDPPLHMNVRGERQANRSAVARNKRSAKDTAVHRPYNANDKSRYVELVLVADHREFQANGGNLRFLHSKMKDIANIINSVYAPLNIFIALVGVEVWSEKDQIHLDVESGITLDQFMQYRRTNLARSIPNDNAHLITRQRFNNGTVGKAGVGTMCTLSNSGGIASHHTDVIGLFAATIAHEMGHNFGMDHDAEDCICPDEQCIMYEASTEVIPTHWSTCSLRSLALSFELGMDYCLRNKPNRLFESPTCGNGFIEAGEQCDCGLESGELSACSACCDPRSCMLRANATCGAGACCDLQTCRPRAAGAECRAAQRECDLPEYCSGHSEFCPRDVHKMDATPCGAERQAYCVKGACRSHSDQCRLLWGTTGKTSHDQCYTTYNIKGNKHGNCGYDRLLEQYKACSEEDVHCGLLQCWRLNNKLQFGRHLNGTIQGTTYILKDKGDSFMQCHTVMVDLGLNDVDPGMVPDGARCGHEKMCLKQRCVSVASVQEEIARRRTSVCPSDCSGHGVCNSEGHCHCEPGFAPPLCSDPGPGGSYDSGPASDPLVQRNFMVAMYVIFLGIVPAILLALFLVYYFKIRTCFVTNKHRVAESLRELLSFKSRSRAVNSNIGNSQNNEIRCPIPEAISTCRVKNTVAILQKHEPVRSIPQATSTYGVKNTVANLQKHEPIRSITETISTHGVKDTVANFKKQEAIKSEPTGTQRVKDKVNFLNVHFHENTKEKPLKKFERKINKDDIRIASNDDIAKAQRPRPPVKPKPQASKESRPSVLIVKQGLASTTNQMLAGANHRLYNVGTTDNVYENITVKKSYR